MILIVVYDIVLLIVTRGCRYTASRGWRRLFLLTTRLDWLVARSWGCGEIRVAAHHTASLPAVAVLDWLLHVAKRRGIAYRTNSTVQ